MSTSFEANGGGKYAQNSRCVSPVNYPLIKQTDFVLAFLIFVLTSAGVWWAYAALHEQQLKGGLLNEPVKVGRREHAVLSGSACVGTLFSELNDGEGFLNLGLGGDIHAVFRERILRIHLKGEASFNVLGQMGGGIFNLKAEDLDMKVGLLEIDPITVTVNGVIGGRKLKHKFSIPGPVELKHAGPGRYKLYYRHLRALNNPYAAGLIEQSRQAMGLKIVPLEDGSATCVKENLVSLNLDIPARLLATQLHAVLSLFGMNMTLP